jgi:hypothetical protein
MVLAAFGSHVGNSTKPAHANVTAVDLIDPAGLLVDDDTGCTADTSAPDTFDYSLNSIGFGEVLHVPVNSLLMFCIDVSNDTEGLTVDTSEASISIGGCFNAATDPQWDPDNCIGTLAQGTDSVHFEGDPDNGANDLTNGTAVLIACPSTYAVLPITLDHDDEEFLFFIVCHANPAAGSTIAAVPNTVEIVRAPGSVSHSLITLTLVDSAGNPAMPGTNIDIDTDRCSLSDKYVFFEDGFELSESVFNGLKKNNPFTADVLEGGTPVLDHTAGSPPHPTAPAIDTNSFSVTGNVAPFTMRTVAAAILHCEDTSIVPGVATITARIHVPGPDIVKTVQVTVVGPPFAITVSTDKTSVICGERVTVTAKITDSAGQPVSDHTLAEAISNLGSVLGGTGAVAHFAAPVTPISSTVGETFSGIVTFYLLTSDTQDGVYEIVVTSGGMGSLSGFWSDNVEPFALGSTALWWQDFNLDHISLGGFWSTPPVSGFAQVTCAQPAPAAPTISGPATGTGPLRAPNTGDGGLADSGSSSSWVLLAGAAVAFALAGLATIKFARR